MLHLVADSGSTKTDWVVLYNGQDIDRFQTIGLNPVHLSEEKIVSILIESSELSAFIADASKITFFGAGCGNDEGRKKMLAVMHKVFPSAGIDVQSDLMAAAISTCGVENGIVSILGTGSNCCYFNGENLEFGNYGMGYIIGDEGSGAYFGKQFLRAYLYRQMPEKLATRFQEKYDLGKDEVITRVYTRPNAGQWLASFMPFILEHYDHKWVSKMLYAGIVEFFETNIAGMMTKAAYGTKLHFVGSVAEALTDEIYLVAEQKQYTVGNIIKSPMENLVNFYLLQDRFS